MQGLQELILIAVGTAFVNNVVLSQFLGICPFLGVSKNTKTAAGMGGAVVFVITIASFVTGLIYKFILGNPNIMGGELDYLNTIVFILVIAALVQFVEMFLKKSMPSLYKMCIRDRYYADHCARGCPAGGKEGLYTYSEGDGAADEYSVSSRLQRNGSGSGGKGSVLEGASEL